MTLFGRSTLTAEQIAVLEQATERYQQGHLTDQEFLGILIDAGVSAYRAGQALRNLHRLGRRVRVS